MSRLVQKKHLATGLKALQTISQYRLGIFIVLCLTLGGTSQDIVTPKLPLYLLSLFVIGWSLAVINSNSRIWELKTLIGLFAVFVMLFILHLVPLPPDIWTKLPQRGVVQQGFELMEMELPWLPLSLMPERTLFSLFDFLPPFAVICLVGVLASAQEIKNSLWIITGFAAASVVLGIVQVSGAFDSLYFYDFTNEKSPVGFFSNINHQASFLLMVLPFAIYLLLESTSLWARRNYPPAKLGFGFIFGFAIIIGILLAGSGASYVLIIPVFLGALLICRPFMKIKRAYIYIIAGIFILGIVIDSIFFGGVFEDLLAQFVVTEEGGRRSMFSTTLAAAKDFFPFGSGAGSFENTYKLYEQPGRTTIPHAHNEYVELLLEFGLAGIALGGAFLVWWITVIWRVLKSPLKSSVLARCASLSTASVFIHSIADYPIRTIGLSVLVVFCLCIMVLYRDTEHQI